MKREKKEMGLFALTALVAGDMIGSGIFLLPANLAELGSLSLVSWIFTGLGTIFLAFIFSHMSQLIPKTGGPYAYAQHVFGDFIGFQTAYCYWIAIWVGNAAIALAAAGYLAVFFPALKSSLNAAIWSIIFVWIFTFVNMIGVHSAGLVQSVTMVLKLIPILFIGFFGWIYFNPQLISESLNVTSPATSNFSLITHAATLTLWAFIGVESATVPAGSVKDPKRTIPMATFLGAAIALVAYISSSAAIMGMIPNAILKTSTSPFAAAAQIILGRWGEWFVALGAIISCLGCLNGWILLQGQIPMAAARDHLFPNIFRKINNRHVPGWGILITSVLISALLLLTISSTLVEQFKVIILIATLANLVPYLYTSVADLLIVKQMRSRKGKLMTLAVLATLYSAWAIYGAGQQILYYGALLLLSSMPLYFFVPVHHKGAKIKLPSKTPKTTSKSA